MLAPSLMTLQPLSLQIDRRKFRLAAQNAFYQDEGAFTGEVSASMLKEAGARWAIVGHSERRQFYGETDESVNAKIRASQGAGLSPIVCVGERLEDRDAGRAEQVVEAQLSLGMHNLTASEASRIIIAYEPVWAIGTGRTATPETAQQMHAFIRSRIGMMFGQQVADAIRVLYGGSVKADDIVSLMSQPDIDGALVGGASLEPESFASIVNYKERGTN